jgi:hypothetical protein
MVGQKVTLNIILEGIGNAFNGFRHPESIHEEILSVPPAQKFWDAERGRFLGTDPAIVPGQDIQYYTQWLASSKYTSPTDYSVFTYNGVNYVWLNGVLVPDKLTGQALCTQFHPVGTVGNLLQGSFAFVGDGPLAAPE